MKGEGDPLVFIHDILFITPMKNPTQFKDYMNQANAMDTHDTRESLRKINTPTSIFSAKKDRLIPRLHQEYLEQMIPNSNLEKLEGCGHRSTKKEPDKVNELIWNFIKENM